jgi:hypothetical protein
MSEVQPVISYEVPNYTCIRGGYHCHCNAPVGCCLLLVLLLLICYSIVVVRGRPPAAFC